MKRIVRVVVVAGVAALLAALLGAAAASAMVRNYSANQLTDRAATIVVAKALTSHSRWTHPRADSLEGKGTIVTDVDLAVYELLKGDAARKMSITVPGGEVGEYSMPIPDAPVFQPGQMYVVFLDANGQVIAWRVGQPQVVGDRVPALKLSLVGLKAKVARRTGAEARVLRSWSAGAPAGGAAAQSAGAAPTGGSAIVSNSLQTGPVGEPTSAVAPASTAGQPQGTTRPLPQAAVAPRGSSVLFSDGFETPATSDGTLPGWTLAWSNPNPSSQFTWGRHILFASEGSGSVFAQYWERADLGFPWWVYDEHIPGTMNYQPSQNCWMMLSQPLNLSSIPYAKVVFDGWTDIQPNVLDGMSVGVKVGGDTSDGQYYGLKWWGETGPDYDFNFERMSLDLNNVYTLGNVCGQPKVWLAFWFQSNNDGISGLGAGVDNVSVVGSSEPFPTITAVTPPNAPAGTYLQPTRNQSRITIQGSGFGATPGRVDFFYQDGEPLIQADSVASWADTQIVCDVPVGVVNNYSASAGSGPVYVTSAGGTQSAGFDITVPYSVKGTEWPASRCLYRMNMDATQAGLVNAGAQAWNNAGTAFQFVNTGACLTTTIGSGEETQMPLDTYNDMCFAGLPWDGVIACAWPRAKNDVIYECDIVFNTNGISWGDGSGGTMDIQTIATHEMGHWLSLRDLYGADTDKIMYGFGGAGAVKRTLSAGDVAGAQWIYGDNTVDSKRPTTAAKNAKVRRGRTAKITLRVSDAWPSIGTATLKVQVKNARGRVVKKAAARVRTNEWLAWTFKCKLARGTYRVYTYATDDMGFKQSRIKVGKLTVK